MGTEQDQIGTNDLGGFLAINGAGSPRAISAVAGMMRLFIGVQMALEVLQGDLF